MNKHDHTCSSIIENIEARFSDTKYDGERIPELFLTHTTPISINTSLLYCFSLRYGYIRNQTNIQIYQNVQRAISGTHGMVLDICGNFFIYICVGCICELIVFPVGCTHNQKTTMLSMFQKVPRIMFHYSLTSQLQCCTHFENL